MSQHRQALYEKERQLLIKIKCFQDELAATNFPDRACPLMAKQINRYEVVLDMLQDNIYLLHQSFSESKAYGFTGTEGTPE
jgi:hypothetical protein